MNPVTNGRTGPTGGFVLELDPGAYLVVASQAGYSFSAPTEALLTEESGATLLITLRSLSPASVTVTANPREDRSSYLTGRVLAAPGEDPIEGADVVLAETGQHTVTNANGRFVFPEVEAGIRTVSVEYLGYGRQEMELVVEPGIGYQFDVRMAVEAIELEGITVRTRARSQARRLAPVFQRMDWGTFGDFLTVEEFEKSGNPPVAAMLREIPGLTVESRGIFWRVRVNRGCAPTIYVDGVRMDRGGQSDFLNMSTLGVEVVEVYKGPASLPPEYNDPGTFCAIGIWTKRGG